MHVINGTKSELQLAIDKLKRQQAELARYYELDATIKKSRYDSLIKAGFNPDQAIALLKSE